MKYFRERHLRIANYLIEYYKLNALWKHHRAFLFRDWYELQFPKQKKTLHFRAEPSFILDDHSITMIR